MKVNVLHLVRVMYAALIVLLIGVVGMTKVIAQQPQQNKVSYISADTRDEVSVSNTGPYCVGDTIYLIATGPSGASYRWTGPANFRSNEQNPSRPNGIMHPAHNCAGTYRCTVTMPDGSTIIGTTVVTIYPTPIPIFYSSPTCFGSAIAFENKSRGFRGIWQGNNNPVWLTTQNASFLWEFGDGQTSTGYQPNHTYARPGTYEVTLTVSTGDSLCVDQITQSVVVYTALDVDIEVEGDTELCPGDTVMLHAVVELEFTYVAPGDIICMNGSIVRSDKWQSSMGAKGVVFYVDNTDLHGWAVSLTQSDNLQWSTMPTSIGTPRDQWRDAIRDLAGRDNTQAILGSGIQADAASWPQTLGSGWYLPSAGQLNVLSGALMAVNASLNTVNTVGGIPIVDPGTGTAADGGLYLWSSTEKNASGAYALEVLDGQIGGVTKNVALTTGKQYVVRAIMDF